MDDLQAGVPIPRRGDLEAFARKTVRQQSGDIRLILDDGDVIHEPGVFQLGGHWK